MKFQQWLPPNGSFKQYTLKQWIGLVLIGLAAGNAAKYGTPLAIEYWDRMQTGDVIGLKGNLRSTFIDGTTRVCQKNQTDFPENKGVSASMFFEYCKCYAEGIADMVSINQLKAMHRAGNYDDFQPAIDALLERCKDR